MWKVLFQSHRLNQINIHFALVPTESRLEGWLSLPNKQNIKRYGWKKQYVVVSSKKILFYENEHSKMNADPKLVLDIE